MPGGISKNNASEISLDIGADHGDDFPAETHPLFCEMLELRPDLSLWRETARWVKFEENVEEDGNRWSKPYVASLSLHAIMELRSLIGTGSIMLNLDATSLNEIFNILAEDWNRLAMIPASLHEAVVATLLQPYKHQHQHGGAGRLLTTHAKDEKKAKFQRSISVASRSMSTHERPSRVSVSTLSDDDLGLEDEKPNKRFLKKLPPGAEAATILVGELEFIHRPLCAFVALKHPTCLKNLVEVSAPSRYIFVLLMPKHRGSMITREIGRTMGTLFSDEIFQREISNAHSRHDLLGAVDNFMGCSTVLPPGEWNPTIRIEPPAKVESHEMRMSKKRAREGEQSAITQEAHESHGSDIKRTGRFCGGLVDDVKRKMKWYVSDFKDALAVQSIASIIFLYFASMTPLVTFGGLMNSLLHGRMGAMETILGRAISGVFWGFTAGQPLVILGSTGPILVFEVITFNLCVKIGIEYLEFRVWIGIWSAVILLLMTAFDLSFLVGYITRFTEESFAALVSAIFVYEAIKKLLYIAKERPIRTNPAINPANFHECECYLERNLTFGSGNDSEATLAYNESASLLSYTYNETWDDNATSFLESNYTFLPFSENFSRVDCKKMNYTMLIGPGCTTPDYIADAFLLSVCLFFGTFIMSRILKSSKVSPYFPSMFRQVISDFAVIISIFTFVMVDYLLGIATPKLTVPDVVKPTYVKRDSWLVDLFGQNPWWTIIVAIAPGILATILIFMDQQITTVIVSRKENKLRHGVGYHLDLLIVAILVGLLSWIGMPWMIADTVLSLTHSSSLRMESAVAAPGERPTFLGIREQRVTNIIISLLIGVSVFLTKFLQMIPMPVLFGVFLFMGSNAFLGLQFTDRLKLVLMPLKYQPDFVYLRHVKITRVHIFTLIQLLCLVLLWTLKTFDETAMLFPVMVGALVGVRKLLDYVFTQKELSYLDDIMPETTKRKKEDSSKSRKKSRSHSKTIRFQHPDEEYFKADASGLVRIPLPNGNVLTVPVGAYDKSMSGNMSQDFSSTVQQTGLWKKISVANALGDYGPKNGDPTGARWTQKTENDGDEDPEKRQLLNQSP